MPSRLSCYLLYKVPRYLGTYLRLTYRRIQKVQLEYSLLRSRRVPGGGRRKCGAATNNAAHCMMHAVANSNGSIGKTKLLAEIFLFVNMSVLLPA